MINGIISVLKADATIDSLIGDNNNASKVKVYPGICPQPEKHPYIIVRKSGKVPFNPCKGVRSTRHTYSAQVIIYHKNYNKLDEIEQAVIEALDFYESGNIKTVQFQTSYDDEYIKEFNLHTRVLEFEGIANEDTIT